jgi:hypothetical protein
VRIWQLERYITPHATTRGPEGARDVPADALPLVLTADRWILEVYRTLIGTLQSIAWMLLVVFVFALLAYVIVRAMEMRRGAKLE